MYILYLYINNKKHFSIKMIEYVGLSKPKTYIMVYEHARLRW